MVKCQDMSYANRLHLVTLDVLRDITENGFELADQFLLVNTPNLSSGAWKRQERARRSHSVLWVACKTASESQRIAAGTADEKSDGQAENAEVRHGAKDADLD